MLQFGIEIFDAKIYKDCPLEEELPLEDQWFFLTNDVWYMEYHFRDMIFGVDISWYGDFEDVYNPENRFKVDVSGWGAIEYKVVYKVVVGPDLQALKQALQKAIDLVQLIKVMSVEEIEALPNFEDLSNLELT
jgi:hypothetical protein